MNNFFKLAILSLTFIMTNVMASNALNNHNNLSKEEICEIKNNTKKIYKIIESLVDCEEEKILLEESGEQSEKELKGIEKKIDKKISKFKECLTKKFNLNIVDLTLEDIFNNQEYFQKIESVFPSLIDELKYIMFRKCQNFIDCIADKINNSDTEGLLKLLSSLNSKEVDLLYEVNRVRINNYLFKYFCKKLPVDGFTLIKAIPYLNNNKLELAIAEILHEVFINSYEEKIKNGIYNEIRKYNLIKFPLEKILWTHYCAFPRIIICE